MKILLAEPHRPTREHLYAQLTQAGHTVVLAEGTVDGIELFVSEHPDAVLLAVDCPSSGELNLGEWIRAQPRGRLLPLVVLDKQHLRRPVGIGAVLELKPHAYVADPMRGTDLMSRLSQIAAPSQVVAGTEATLARPPTASGPLEGHPLIELAHGLFRTRSSGVLVVIERTHMRHAYYLAGQSVGFQGSERGDGLSAFLFEQGRVTQEQQRRVERALDGGLRIAAALVEAEVDLEQDQEPGIDLLSELRRAYVRDRVGKVIASGRGRFAFHPGEEFLAELSPVPVPGLAPILDGARRSFSMRRFARALKPRLRDYPYRTESFRADFAAMALETPDVRLALQITGDLKLEALLREAPDLRRAHSLLWFLGLTHGIAFSHVPVASASGVLESAQLRFSPKRKKPLPPELTHELREAAVRIITSSYFGVLGLDIAADAEAVERAYHQVAARFHPDSYPEYDTSEIDALLESVQEKLSAAYRVLSADEKRKAYLQYLLSKIETGRQAPINVDAEIALRRGDNALKRKDPRSALAAFEEAIALNSREPSYYCHLAWATYLATSGPDKARAKAAQKILKRAFSLDSEHERARVISAIIEGETADPSAARKALVRVLERNPKLELAKWALRRVGR